MSNTHHRALKSSISTSHKYFVHLSVIRFSKKSGNQTLRNINRHTVLKIRLFQVIILQFYYLFMRTKNTLQNHRKEVERRDRHKKKTCQ